MRTNSFGLNRDFHNAAQHIAQYASKIRVSREATAGGEECLLDIDFMPLGAQKISPLLSSATFCDDVTSAFVVNGVEKLKSHWQGVKMGHDGYEPAHLQLRAPIKNKRMFELFHEIVALHMKKRRVAKPFQFSLVCNPN